MWWEGGLPHQVGYIDRGGDQNVGETPEERSASVSGSSKDRSVSSSSTPKPTPEELVEIKAIMKGDKKLSKENDKRTRQEELIKLMIAKKSRDEGSGTGSVNTSSPSSSASIKPPTADELTEAKEIMKGQKELSTEKDKRSRQKELMKMIMGKRPTGDASQGGTHSQLGTSSSISPPTADELTKLKNILAGKAELSVDKAKRARQKELIKMVTAGGSNDGLKDGFSSRKKGVRFDDEVSGSTLPGANIAIVPNEQESKPSPSSRPGSSSTSVEPNSSRASSSQEAHSTSAIPKDHSVPGPRRSNKPDIDGPGGQDE